MPIPDLDQEGLLPPGIHEVTVEEIHERFGRFRKSDRRASLFGKLRDFLAEIRSTGLLAAVIVNGSFVTGKDEPSDIDVLLILRSDHDFSAELRPFEYNVLSRRRVRQRYRFGILVARRFGRIR
jgi:predicted nucleotidyltransferase